MAPIWAPRSSFDIKCRKAGLAPAAAVIVATVRALKMHGGVGKAELGAENLTALRKGLANLDRHVRNVRRFGVPSVVAINRFYTDTEAELALIGEHCRRELGVEALVCEHWATGSAGTEALAQHVVHLCESPHSMDGLGFTHLYPDEMPLWDKMRTIAREIYGAEDIIADQRVREQFKDFQAKGFGHFPICVAKTQYSFSTDPDRKGAPSRAYGPDPGAAPGRRGRVPGRGLWRDHDHAGSAAAAGGPADQARWQGRHRGPILNARALRVEPAWALEV